MNYFPYYNYIPYMAPNMMASAAPKGLGLFSRLASGAKGIQWSTLLGNAQKALGVVNQAIPVVKQVTPVMKNAKTMFKVMNEFKKVDTPTTSNSQPSSNSQPTSNTTSIQPNVNYTESVSNDSQPTFFI